MWEQLFEMIFKPDFLFSVIRITSPILFAALAAVVAEKAGVTNIGLEGIMSITALFGTLISYWTQSWAVGVLGALIVGIALSLIHISMCIRDRLMPPIERFICASACEGATYQNELYI